MPLIRHKTTLHELHVPDGYNPDSFPDYEPAEGRRRAPARKPEARKRTTKKTAAQQSTPAAPTSGTGDPTE